MQSSPPDGSRWRTLALTSLGHFVNDGSVMFVAIVADIVVSEGVPLFIVPLMSAVFYSSSALASLAVGDWADRSGSHGKGVGAGLALLSLGMVGFYASISHASGLVLAASVTASSVVAGVGGAFYHPLAATVLQGVFQRQTKGRALGVNGAAGGMGATTYPLIFFAAAIFLSNSVALLVLALIGLASASVIWVGLRRPEVGRREAGKGRSSIRGAVTRGIVVLVVITSIRAVSTTGVSFWLPTYISGMKGTGISAALGLTLSVMYAFAIFGQLLFGAMMDRFDKRLVLGLGSAGSAASIVGYIYTSGAVELLFIGLFGLFTFSNFPTLLALASEYVPESSRSSGNSLVWGVGITGGSVIGPVVVGAIVGNNYPLLNLAFVAMAVLGLAGALVTPLMPKPDGSAETGTRTG